MTFPPRRSSSSSFTATHPTAKILIVDDEPANVVLIRCILEDAGYRNLRTVTDSGQVEALCREDDPDLVLLDLHMPGLSGYEVLAQLAPLTPPDGFRPVLVLSADIVPQNRQRALAAGASDFLSKPFDRVEVLLRISNLLKMRFLQEQVRRQSEVFEGMVVERTTQLERALTDLHATQQQIIQQERLSALGTMAGGVVHDFNNVLSVVMGLTDLLLLRARDLGLSEEVSATLQTVLNASRDGAGMVNRLRDFYRPRELGEDQHPLCLDELLREAVRQTQPRWAAVGGAAATTTTVNGKPPSSRAGEIRLETDLRAGNAARVLGNAGELREVLTNLIFNAVDALPRGGHIRLRSWLDADRDQAILEVADDGIGMDEETRRRCLEPFFTTKGAAGTGLGLAVVHGIVGRHNGELSVESTPGQGTTFRLTLPALAPRTKLSPGEPSPPRDEHPYGNGTSPLPPRSLHVLVADDQPVFRDVLTRYLSADGHVARTAADGTAALALFDAGGPFDLVITDESMPGLGGRELAAAIRARAPAQPVILLTGYTDLNPAGMAAAAATAGELRPAGVDQVLRKPIAIEELRRAIVAVVAAVPNGNN